MRRESGFKSISVHFWLLLVVPTIMIGQIIEIQSCNSTCTQLVQLSTNFSIESGKALSSIARKLIKSIWRKINKLRVAGSSGCGRDSAKGSFEPREMYNLWNPFTWFYRFYLIYHLRFNFIHKIEQPDRLNLSKICE